MQDLIDQKKKIVEEHLPNLLQMKTKANLEILKLLTKTLKDRKISAKVHLGILDRLKVGGQIGSESSIELDSQQRLEMIRMWFENAEATLGSIKDLEKLGYESVLKTIDEQMQLYREEYRQINEELKKAEDEDKRIKLEEERNKIRWKL